MVELIKRTIRDRRTSILAYSLGSLAFAEMYVAMFPSIRDKAAEFSDLLAAYPEELIKVLGLSKENLVFDTIEKFISVEHLSIVFPIILFSMFIGWGGSALAGEIDKGTISFLLSKPLSRVKIYFAKYIAGLLALVFLLIVSIIGIIPLARLHGLDYLGPNYVAIAVLSFGLGLAVLSLSMFLSALFNDKGKPYFIASAIMILMYVMNLLSVLQESLVNLKYGSFFYYYDYQAAFLKNEYDILSLGVFFDVSIVFTTLGAWWFNKRDISV